MRSAPADLGAASSPRGQIHSSPKKPTTNSTSTPASNKQEKKREEEDVKSKESLKQSDPKKPNKNSKKESFNDEEEHFEMPRYVTRLDELPTLLQYFTRGKQNMEVPEEASRVFGRLSFFNGDITKLQVDAIVNAANSSLLGGGGVDGAIHRAAGPMLLAKCRTLQGCRTGDAKVTDGYDIKWIKKIIHTVGPQCYLKSPSEEERRKLSSCYRTSMDRLLEHNLRTIAFPCISTGIYGYPNADACSVVTEFLKKFLENAENAEKIDRVVLCTFLEIDQHFYTEQMNNLWNSYRNPKDEAIRVKKNNKAETSSSSFTEKLPRNPTKKMRTEV